MVTKQTISGPLPIDTLVRTILNGHDGTLQPRVFKYYCMLLVDLSRALPEQTQDIATAIASLGATEFGLRSRLLAETEANPYCDVIELACDLEIAPGYQQADWAELAAKVKALPTGDES